MTQTTIPPFINNIKDNDNFIDNDSRTTNYNHNNQNNDFINNDSNVINDFNPFYTTTPFETTTTTTTTTRKTRTTTVHITPVSNSIESSYSNTITSYTNTEYAYASSIEEYEEGHNLSFLISISILSGIFLIVIIPYCIIINYKKKLKKLKRDYKNLEMINNLENKKKHEMFNSKNDDSNGTLVIENDDIINLNEDFIHIPKNITMHRNDSCNRTIYNNDISCNDSNNEHELNNSNNHNNNFNEDPIPSYNECANPYLNIDYYPITSFDSSNHPPSYRSSDSNPILLNSNNNNDNNNNNNNNNNRQYIPYALPNYFINNIPPQVLGVQPNDPNCNYVPVYIPVNALPFNMIPPSNAQSQSIVNSKTQQQILNDIKNNEIKKKPLDEVEEKIGKTPFDAIPLDRVQPEPELRHNH